jgi:nitroreductase
MLRRRSHSSVGDEAPRDKQLRRAIEVAGTVADHGSLRPWRVIALRGEARERVGRALAEASGASGSDAEKLARKPLRAPLLLAIVVAPKPSAKVHDWEQEAVAAGVAHALTLLLDEEGWGVMWRSGHFTRADAVRRAHGLADDERLLGWLYVGSRPSKKSGRRRPIDAAKHFSSL